MTLRSFLSLPRMDFVLGDLFADFAQFVEDFVDRELGEAIELQFEDGVDLAER